MIIVDVEKENLNDADSDDFGESRLAGLVRQHSASNFIFTIQVPNDNEQSGDSLAKKLENSLSSTLPQGLEVVTGSSLDEIYSKVRDKTFKCL